MYLEYLMTKCLSLACGQQIGYQFSALLRLPFHAHFSTIDNNISLHFTRIIQCIHLLHTIFLQNSIFSHQLAHFVIQLLDVVATVQNYYLVDYYSAILLHILQHRSMSNGKNDNLILCVMVCKHITLYSRFKQAYKPIIQQKLVTQL